MSEVIQKMQAIEQNLQMLRTQLHGVKSQLLENTTALKSLEGKDEGYVFVAGDHPKSFDSRYDEFGLVNIENIQGRAIWWW